MSWNSKTWSWVKKYFSVNPLSSNGMPPVGSFRTPAPGSRPEKYVYPKSSASNVSNNYYFQRDARRNYPRLAVYTQQSVAGLLEGVPATAITAGDETATAVDKIQDTKPLTKVLDQKILYSASGKAPPTPNWGRPMTWKESEDFVLPDDGSYFPMRCFTTA